MVTSGASVREAVVGTVEQVDAVVDVLGSMGVNQVYDNLQSKAMCLIYQVLEVIRCATSRTNAKEACDVVAKACIV